MLSSFYNKNIQSIRGPLVLSFVFCFCSTTEADNNVTINPYVEVCGKQLGVDQGFSTLGLFSSYNNPKLFSPHLSLYNDLSWYHLINGTNAGSLEAGYLWDSEKITYGSYIAYDVRRWHKNSFDQLSIGSQLILCPWHFLFNISFPFQNEQTNFRSCFHFEGGFHASMRNCDITYRMISATFIREICTPNPCIKLAVGIEPYYLLSGSRNCWKKDKSSLGTNLRIFLDYSPFNVEANLSYDNVFKTCSQIVIGFDLSYLFNNLCSCSQPRRTYRNRRFVPLKNEEYWNYNWCIPSSCSR
jgi:hypothetical protein